MKPRSLLTLSLIACLLAACTTSTSTTTAQPPTAQATTAPTPVPVVTSRGPNLEASDPSVVSMASGGLQFVEFFEFW